MQTRDQEYAIKSYAVVSNRLARLNDDKKKKEYKSFAKHFPTLIHTCGLMQAIAFAFRDEKKPGFMVLEDFVKVLEGEQTNVANFVRSSQNLEMLQYISKSRFAMLAAGWIKRQADALIEGEEGGDDASDP